MCPNKKSILVFAATGSQGGGAVLHCLKAGHEVFAYVRDPGSAAAQGLEKLGAKLVQGTLEDVEALESATQVVDAVFTIEVRTGDAPGDRRRITNIIAAARASPRVTTMIVTTAAKTGQHESFPGWGPDHPMYSYWLEKHAVEDLVRDAGFQHWTIIRPAHFLQNFLGPIGAFFFQGLADDLIMRVAWKPESRIAWVDCSDVGVVAAAAVSNPEKYTGREIEFAVEALNTEELAAKLSKALGSEIKVHYYSEAEIAEVANNSPVPRSQRWANEVPGAEAAQAAEEFPLTSVDAFFARNISQIFPGR